ncbi:hypothetical protein Dsin_029925 [Dipteronia sinensis]|uniref:Ubiquitin-like domain-containing protein n=1 Tax=Dipteronia sinensis TaxID=43782 RepID=A0AAD9ZU03_9ROSI|nr:hypothetical protein Dsin_029925 [Dipteronia sinensis]
MVKKEHLTPLPRNRKTNSSDDEEINIYFTINKTIAMKVKKSETIENLKLMLHDKEGILEKNQDLYLGYNHLPNGGRINDYNIPNNSIVRVNELSPIKIYVKLPSNQKTLEFKVNKSDTIEKIKINIKYIGGIQSNNYSLYYAGKLVEDRMTVASLEMQNGATLQMVTNPNDKLSISVETPNGETIDVEIKCWHTAVQVKRIVESMTNWSSNDWDLSVGTMKMRLMNSKTLAFYDIKENDILKMLPASYQISVRTQDGKIMKNVEVKQSDIICAVKEKYFQQTDVPVNRQRLMFGGQILEDNKDLAHYSIEEGFTILV